MVGLMLNSDSFLMSQKGTNQHIRAGNGPGQSTRVPHLGLELGCSLRLWAALEPSYCPDGYIGEYE